MSAVAASGRHDLGGREVTRLGFGAAQLTGVGVWGPPEDRAEAIRTARRAIELGVDLVDTSNSYGPHTSEEVLREAIHPYDGLLVSSKAGVVRSGPDAWAINGRPEYLKRTCEECLDRLGLECFGLFYLHRIDPAVPPAEQFGALAELIEEGKIERAGLSEVSVEEIEAAREVVPIAAVQNLYNLVERGSENVLNHCEREGIAFVPGYPVASGELAKEGGVLDSMAREKGATPPQVAIAWLLARSPVILPIPGTKRVVHLEENLGGAGVELSPAEVEALTALVAGPPQ